MYISQNRRISKMVSINLVKDSKIFKLTNLTIITTYCRMSIKEIVVLPNPILRKICDPISCVDDEIRKLADDMIETMYYHEGIGLAANQVGMPLRLVVVDVSKNVDSRNALVIINPEITWTSEETEVAEEGCLSIPELREEVERPIKLNLQFLDRNGDVNKLPAENLFARCLQHEIDHLNGRLIIDYLSKLRREMIIKKYTKLAR